MKRLILASASVLALAIGGAGVSFGAMGNTAPNAGTNMTTSATSQPAPNAMNSPRTWTSSKQEIQQAQEQLRDQGLYHGKVDGVLGRQTKQALEQFQQKNGLRVTATPDQPTMDKLLGNPAVGAGSSVPPNSGQTSPHPAAPPSNLGDHSAPRQ